ncbi:MAG: hypothetical protein AAF587_37770 [Bacteroidota bacterium]
MSNIRLAGTSILIITILAGIPHIFARYSPSDKAPSKSFSYSALLGDWKASYDSEEFRGEVIYQFREKEGSLKAYSIKLTDENGNSMKDNSLVLVLTSFEEKQGTARYGLEYEGERYEVESEIELIDDSKLQISYDYFGYSDTEYWHKISK